MKKLIVISDWVDDALSRQEFQTAVEGYLGDPRGLNISFVSTTPSTIHTAYVLSQIVETEERLGRPLETIIFQYADPRIESASSLQQSKGAAFLIVRLASGLFLCGPNAGYNYAMIRNKMQKVFTYPNFDKQSQFLSRDLYSRMAAHLMDAMEDELEFEEAHPSVIPGLQGFHIGHIDNFGNIKTTIPHSHLKGKHRPEDMIPIRINGVERKVKYVSHMFGGFPGELILFPGSSGTQDDPYLEISIWRHFTEKDPTTGIHAFKDPKPGMEIEMK